MLAQSVLWLDRLLDDRAKQRRGLLMFEELQPTYG
jgi:hypothetical protein